MRLIILAIIILCASSSKGQERFNKVLNSLGQSNQSRLFDSYCDSNFIYLIGDLMDSVNTPDNPMVRPWIAKMDFNGEIVNQRIIYNEDIEGNIVVKGSQIIEASNGNLLYNTIVFDHNDICHSLVLEISKADLSITSCNSISNPVDSTMALGSGWITRLQGPNNEILLSNLIDLDNHYENNIILLDSTLRIVKSIIIHDNGRDNFSFYCEMNIDSSISLIGYSKRRNDASILRDIKPFYMKINLSGEIQKFNLAEGIPGNSISFTSLDIFDISKDDKGNWLFSAVKLVRTGNCAGCYYMLPYVFSYSPEFDTMNWAFCYAENLNDTEQIYSIYSSKFDTTDQSYIVVGNRLSDFPNNGFIFKIKENGDSLWMKHFIPLNWDPDTIIWALLKDIQIAPDGGYVSVGHVSDQVSQMWRSWIVNIDSDGCLIPGCNLQVNTTEPETSEYFSFSAYPNPASSLLYIDSKVNCEEKYVISLVSIDGEIIKSTQFYPNIGYQYLLDLPEYLNGIYVLRIQDNLSNVVYARQLIID